MSEFISCAECVYDLDCPCGYSKGNAACLTIQLRKTPLFETRSICDLCQYHTKDERCVYVVGCPYNQEAKL